MTQDIVRALTPIIPALRRYARTLLRDPWESDDLVQDCLERAVRHWHSRREEASTRAWLFAILHNLAMTRLRRVARQPHLVPIDELELTSSAPTQEDYLQCKDIMDMLSYLSDEQRSVLLLVAVEDLFYAEVAQILEIPIGTVMSRLSRARDRLHKLLSGDLAQNTSVQLRIIK